MINKIFFPTTFITQQSTTAINRRLGRFAIYQPIKGQTPAILERVSEAAAIELRHPVIGDESYLLELCRAYGSWGGIYQKESLRLNRLAGNGFYNQDFAREISSDVLKNQSGREPAETQKPDPLINARVFLQLAQEFDLREFEIRQGIEKADNASKELFEALRGENAGIDAFSNSKRNAGSINDAGSLMTDTRLAAWAVLSKNDRGAPDIFITDSRTVMELILERVPRVFKLETISNASEPDTAERELSERFYHVADKPWPENATVVEMFSYLEEPAEDGYVLDIYAAADFAPENVLEILTDIPVSPERTSTGSRHAFFCCVAKKNR